MAKAAKSRANGVLKDADPFWEVPKPAPAKKRKPRKPKVKTAQSTALTVPALTIASTPEPLVRRAALAVVGWFKRLSPVPRVAASKSAKKRGRPVGSKDKSPRKRRAASSI